MSDPTPVTNSVIVDESGSTRKRKSTRKVPAWIQVKPWETFDRASGLSDRSAKNAITDATNDSAISAVASQPAFSPRRLPKRSSTTAPSAGNAGITHARSRRFRALIVASALQQIDVVGVDRLPAAEDRDDDRETDRHLGCGDDQREEDDDLTADAGQCVGERDEREVRRVEHQLDAHEHHERVLSHQQADGADREQDRREDEVVGGRDVIRVRDRDHAGVLSCSSRTSPAGTSSAGTSARCPLRRARTTLPTTAITRSTAVISNAHTKSVNRL